MIDNIDYILNGVSHIYSEKINLNESFLVFSSRFAQHYGTIILLSDGNENYGRYNILGYNPWLKFYGKKQDISIIVDKTKIKIKANPLKILKKILKVCSINEKLESTSPITTGLLGYLSYDLKNNLEKMPLTSIDDLHLPDICFFAPSIIVVQDIFTNTTELFVSSSKSSGIKEQKKVLKNFYKKLNNPPPFQDFSNKGKTKEHRSNITHEEYISAVKKIKEYIIKGHVYQVNMSHRFDIDFEGNGFAFLKAMYDINPAPFFAYINAGDHQIISTSPERLIMQNGLEVESRPIKGTRPRGKNLRKDLLMKKELLNSKKDDSELSMIVDLIRNDLGKVCQKNTVNIIKHKQLETYHNVFHLVSTIEGKLKNNSDSIDLIRAIFPGGSITGCPKIRSMEIIDELEANCRHIYTGSIGYISFHQTMDLSVAIRTATIHDGRIFFSVGGGIVYDSDPEEEFMETLHKGQTITQTFQNNFQKKKSLSFSETMPWIWSNGIIKSSDNAKISISDLGLSYGFGFFETILVKNEHIYSLKEHILRFNKSWTTLFENPIPNLSWSVIIKQVLDANKIQKQSVVIKIIATRGTSTSKVGSIFVIAKHHKPRLSNDKEIGLKVAIYPKYRYIPLASHKTLNYLFYHLAGLWATNNGFDEAIILNPDQTISEGNSTNIILLQSKTIISPTSTFSLPGITVNKIINQLKNSGYNSINRPVHPIELFNADAVFLTNSVMGALPIISVNSKPINCDLKIVEDIKTQLYNAKLY